MRRGARRLYTLLPRAAGERERLDLLLKTILTADTLDQIVEALNRRLRAQADPSPPRLGELQQALTQTAREIENYTRAVAAAASPPSSTPPRAAEARRAVLRPDLEHLQGAEPGVVPLRRPALLHRLKELTAKLRSGRPTRGTRFRRRSSASGWRKMEGSRWRLSPRDSWGNWEP
jgi:hypothetical protein